MRTYRPDWQSASAVLAALVIHLATQTLPGVAATPASKGEPKIVNGSFERWQGGAPVGWSVDVGARQGADEPKSIVRKGDGPALMLRGDASTRVWHSVSQSIPVTPQLCYRLAFEGRAENVRHQHRQFDNCYVGMFLKNAAGKILSRQIRNVRATQWTRDVLILRPPAQAARADVIIFLSKSGTLSVRAVRVDRLGPQDSFQALVDDMDRNYSFFKLKGIDWNDLSGRYRRKAEAAGDTSALIKVLAEMLAELKDIHVWVETPQGGRVSAYSSSYRGNFNAQAVAQKLHDVRRFGRLGSVGRTSAGHGVVTVRSLAADEATVRRFLAAVEGLFDAPGMIVDLRSNGGGSEPLGGRIAAMFADQRRLYARSLRRAGPRHDDFQQMPPRVLEPRRGATYRRPVVCLIGPGCVSSGEGLALMMKCLPQVTLAGQPTRGASGNPAPVPLPGGVNVWYSRWISLLPDGTPIEGKGVPPDVLLKHQGLGDPTFNAAVKLLGAKIAESKK